MYAIGISYHNGPMQRIIYAPGSSTRPDRIIAVFTPEVDELYRNAPLGVFADWISEEGCAVLGLTADERDGLEAHLRARDAREQAARNRL